MRPTVKVTTGYVLGLDVFPVVVKAEASEGPSWQIEGLEGVSARELQVRVRSALEVVGVEGAATAPVRLVFDLPEGARGSSGLDLAAAVAVAAHLGRVPVEQAERHWFCSELGLGGALREVRGAFLQARTAIELGRTFVCAQGNQWEAEQAGSVRVEARDQLEEVLNLLTEDAPLDWSQGFWGTLRRKPGLEAAWQAAREAVDGGVRGILLEGPPGAGHTLFARALCQRLPALKDAEWQDMLSIYSVAGLVRDGRLNRRRPFRAPHHSVGEAGLVGGGDGMRPGEASLAHGGVLLLSELPEFRGVVLDALGCAVQQGYVRHVRRGRSYELPTRPRLVVGSRQPCPCGYHGSERCQCTAVQVERYVNRRRLGRLGAVFEQVVQLPAHEGSGA